MPPANSSGAPNSEAKSKRDPAVRSMMTTAAAALVGTAVGGLSVLGVVMAVVQPPQKDLHAATVKDTSSSATGAPTVVAGAPAPVPQANPAPATPVTGATQTSSASSPASPPPLAPVASAAAASSAPAPSPQSVTPMSPPATNALPPRQATAAGSAQPAPPVPQPTTWPDALTARTRAHALETESQQTSAPSPSPVASPEPTPDTAVRSETRSEQTIHDSKAVRIEQTRTESANEHAGERSTARVTSMKRSTAKTEAAKRRVVSEPPPPQPAPVPAAEPAPTTVSVGEAPRGRQLFDFFGLLGGRHVQDQGDVRDQASDGRDQDGAVAATPATAMPAGRSAKVNVGKARFVRDQQHRRVILDQAGAPLAPDSEDGPGRSGRPDDWHHDDWHDNGWHHGWNEGRGDGW